MPKTETIEKTRRSAKWTARHRTIVDVAAKVFARNGYHATGVADLCEVTNLGRGTLYHYIGSKEHLLAAVHDRVMDEVMASVDRVDEAGGNPVEKLTGLGDELLAIITQYPDHVWVFLHEFPALTGEFAATFRRRRREYEQKVESTLRDGVASGHFRPVDVHIAMLAWLGMHNYTYLWLKAGGGPGAQEVARSFADIFITGIAVTPESGR